jgi:DNA-binding winged helix-turn-helix (wHTH) protein
MMYVFGDYALDTTLYELRHVGEPCKMEPRVFNVLAYLIQHRDHVVSREELLEHLWPGVFISESLLNNCIMEARKAVADNGQVQRVIRTVHGRGYRFIAPLTEPRRDPPPRATAIRSESPTAAVPRSQARVALAAPGPGAPGATFQDVLAADQTVVTVVCGALEPVDVLSVAVWGEVGLHLRQTFFALAAEEAERQAGTLTCFGADAVLMLFAQEAHAQRAVRAALALQRRVQDQASALDAQLPTDISVRVGVHTGPLAMPGPTELPWCSSWSTAETTTLAVWLHYLARPGTLLTSHATLPFLHEAVPWTEEGAVRVPGQAKPIMTYRIDGPPTEDARSQA